MIGAGVLVIIAVIIVIIVVATKKDGGGDNPNPPTPGDNPLDYEEYNPFKIDADVPIQSQDWYFNGVLKNGMNN